MTSYNKTKFNNNLEEKLVSLKLDSFIKELANYGEVIFLGGFVRDVYLDVDYPVRDIDIVFNKNSTVETRDVLKIFANDIDQNRFNGFKFTINDIKIDLWQLSDTWAYRENKMKYGHDRLVDTTYLKMDSISYNYNLNEMDAKKFDDVIESRILDIVLMDNPDKELNLVKNLVQKKKYEKLLDISFEFSKCLKKEYVEITEYKGIDSLYQRQIDRYDTEHFTAKELEYWIDQFKSETIHNFV